MAPVYRWVLLWAALCAVQGWSIAATGPEDNAFQAGRKELVDGFYRQAEADFAEFIHKYPNSPLLPEAVLAQVEARVKLTNYAGALELLAVHQAQAGKRADEYLFWQAEALSLKGDVKAAADAFAKLTRDFPASPRRLVAAIREAKDRTRLNEWPRVLELLRDTNGVFQTSIRASVTNEMIARGYLLLSEAHLRQGEYAPAEQTLENLERVQLNPQLSWQRQFLFCRVLLATGRLEPALGASTNLLAQAAALGQPGSQAESFTLYGELLERLQRPAEALAAYQRNLSCETPSERQRQAVVKITEIAELLNKPADAAAAQIIEQFVKNCPGAECADLAILTLGELHLKQHQASPTETKALQQALADFQTFTNRFPQSSFIGKAYLDLGWCFWLTDRIGESQFAFQIAIQKLPASIEQATAWFKLGDAQFRLTNFSAAVGSYTVLIEKFGSRPEVTNTLFEPALYQTVRAGLAARDMGAITNSLSRILAWFPNGFHTDRAVLLAGQEIGHQDPGEARKLFAGIATTAPESPLLPELQLAIARTYEQEGDWNEAIRLYNSWLNQFTNHEGQVRAEYCRALACYRAKQDTNAFMYFTNFLARFPTNEWAPQAQWWVAGYYYGLGDLIAAEQNYQFIYQNTNWPVSELSYQARMMAGRAAFDRQSWKDAGEYFTRLVSITNCPAELRAKAWCALGDTYISRDSTNKLSDYNDALNAFDQVFICCPSNQMAALAWGKKANCLLQCAESSQDYVTVSNAFQQVIESPQADVKARSIALIGIGITLEKLSQLNSGPEQRQFLDLALTRYLDVFYSKHLRAGEQADLFWTHRAGLSAAKLAESLKKYSEALNVYLRLKDSFPSLRLEQKIELLRAQAQQLGKSN